jgi:hypothetical protein
MIGPSQSTGGGMDRPNKLTGSRLIAGTFVEISGAISMRLQHLLYTAVGYAIPSLPLPKKWGGK